jgi:uncharacterized membrane protein
MKTLLGVLVGTLAFLSASSALAQNDTMMNGDWMSGYGRMGGYGGILVPILIAMAVAGVVMWFVKRKDK